MNSLAIARAEERSNIESLNLRRVLFLHLLPGAVVTLVFILIAGLTARQRWPPSLALLVTWLLVGIPIELGFMIYLGLKRNGHLSLKRVVLFREKLAFREYLWLVPLLLAWAAVISTASVFPNAWIQGRFFAWWPDWLLLTGLAGNISRYSPAIVWAVVLLSFPLNLLVPIVEEMYFRGYLLPRMTSLKQWAPLVNVTLFSIYHFWLPWEILTRILVLLPIGYAVWWKRNIYVSIAVHCLLNTIGSIGLLALVLGQQ